MAFIVPMLLYYSISKHSSYFSKIISAIGCIAGVIALILSGSRASWVFFVLGILLILRASIVRTSLEIIPIVKRLYFACVIFFAVTVPIIIIPRLNQLTITFDPSGGAQFRLDLMEKSLMVALQNPLGVGLGVFPQILLEEIGGFTSTPTQPHNLIAQILVASGFVGVISFFGFLYLKITMRYRKRTGESKKSRITRAISMIPIGIFLCLSMLYPVLTEQQIFGWLWILMSIVV
jgi:O-antigen ligase